MTSGPQPILIWFQSRGPESRLRLRPPIPLFLPARYLVAGSTVPLLFARLDWHHVRFWIQGGARLTSLTRTFCELSNESFRMKLLTCQRLRHHLPSRCGGTHLAGISLSFPCCSSLHLNCCIEKGSPLTKSSSTILPPFSKLASIFLFLKTRKGRRKKNPKWLIHSHFLHCP